MKNLMPRSQDFIPLSPQARVELLNDLGMGRGWVLLTMDEMNAIRNNIAAYKEERPQIIEAAYRLKEALDDLVAIEAAPGQGEKRALAFDKAMVAAKLPLPPRPMADPFANTTHAQPQPPATSPEGPK